jgi:hypothetical protein
MAEAAIFIGFGPITSGRERKALETLKKAMAYNARLQSEGEIESFEVVLLEPHGGDLSGFALLRGDADALHRVRTSEEFLSLNTLSGMLTQNFGVVDAYIGEGLARELARFETQMGEMGL